MSKSIHLEEKNSITFEVIRYITLYYFSLAILLTLVQVAIEYLTIKDDIDVHVNEIQESFTESLTNSLWEFNDIQTNAILKGIAKSPSVLHVEVVDPSENIVLHSFPRYGKAIKKENRDISIFNPNKVFTFEKDLIKKIEEGKSENVGKLIIYSGNQIILEQLSHLVFYIITNSIIKTTFLWIILIIFFNKKLRSPMESFVKSISQINPQDPKKIRIEVADDILEFAKIQDAFNNLINELNNYKEVLEAMVENKTEQLKEKNKEVIDLVHKLESAQKQIVKQEKLTSLGLLSAGIAHELKNPLNISKNTNIMIKDLIEEEGISAKDQILSLINVSIENTTRMDNIIKNMLLQARLKNTDFVPTNMHEFVKTNFEIIQKSISPTELEGLVFTNEIPSHISIEVYPSDFGRLLINLFENSLFALRQKKELDAEFIPEIKVSLKEINPNTVLLIVFDNGIGIKKENIDKILEPFFTTKPAGSGTGLGLYLCFEIIKQHNGKVHIYSEENQFSEFHIEIPKRHIINE